MKYILMMNTMKAGHGVPDWPVKDLQAHIGQAKMGYRVPTACFRKARNFLPDTGSSMWRVPSGLTP